MRLLVYGGNEHNIRCEIGSWDLSDKGPLFDTYGIPKDGWTIGFGILNNQGFLFIKTRQTAGARTYPFSILFDPGTETWQKFGWNAAHLAFSLLCVDNLHQRELLNAPENFGIEKLDSMIQGLQCYEFPAVSSSISKLIAGTVFENELVAINPSQFNQTTLSLEEIMSEIESLPPFLRSGNGWLFGGSSENARGLGIKLVFDNNLVSVDHARINHIIQNGEKLLENLSDGGEITRKNLDYFSNMQTWQWQENFNTSAREVLSRLNFLNDLEKRQTVTDEEIIALEQQSSQLFTDEQRKIIIKLASRTNEPLSSFRTGFLLDCLANGELDADQLPVNYLDTETYRKRLVKDGKFPSETGIPFTFKTYDYYEICRDIILNEQKPEAIPELFKRSIEELAKHNASDFIDQLAENVYDKTADKMVDVWMNHTNKDYFLPLKPFFEKAARNIAKNVAQNKNSNWSNIYLRFANDDGGAWLYKNTSPEQALLLIEYFIKIIQDSPENPSRGVTRWLQALTVSPLRGELKNETKASIASLTNELAKSWTNFTSLMDILNERTPAVKKISAVDEAEYLHKELAEFFKTNNPPNLGKLRTPLKNFFGEDTDEYSEETNRRGEKARAEKAGLKNASENVRSTETASKNEFIPFDDQKIINFKQTVEETCKMLQGALSDETVREKFLNNFQFNEKSPVYSAFPLFTLAVRANILQLLYDYRPAELKKELEKLYRSGEYNPFSVAVWECMLVTEIGKTLKAELVKRVGGGTDIDSKLKEYVEKTVEREKWLLNRQTTERPADEKVHRGDQEKGFVDQYLSWLFFWKK